MKIILPNGESLELNEKATGYDAALAISEGLARNAAAVKVNGELVDLRTELSDGDKIEIVTTKSPEGLKIYRHTAAHILAQAIKSIYPTCKLAIGPAIENGFYYDVEFKTPITQADFVKIEKEMKDVIKSDLPIERYTLPKTEALKLMREFKENYKKEMIAEIPAGQQFSFYRQGGFTDFCRGPHLMSTGKIKAFKLTSLTGAYWRGDENNKMLTRIYGTAFLSKTELEDYLKAVEEAKLRDHNKIGRELGLFMTEDTIGQGLPILMPKGAKVIQILSRFVEDTEEARGFMITKTPSMAKSDLYKISGHWDHYRDKMFVIGDENSPDVMALRPMTCPFQYMIYKNGLKSYRDLPCRYSETATEYRKEASGELHGLIRIRQFTLSDGHLICRPDQVEEEFKKCLDLSYYYLECMGLKNDVTYRFSKRGEARKDKYIDDDAAWENTQALMKKILDDIGLEYVEADDEAAFYGPKLDIQAKNVYGKEDTIITIQLDFAASHSFDMTYIDENGEKQYPYVIHRSGIGCYERTLAMLIEKFGGAFPLWLSPTQVKIISVTDRSAEYAKQICEKLKNYGLRAEVDCRSEKMGYKIREAQLEKIPYMLIVGDDEVANGTVSVRSRKAGDLGKMTAEELANMLVAEDREKRV